MKRATATSVLLLLILLAVVLWRYSPGLSSAKPAKALHQPDQTSAPDGSQSVDEVKPKGDAWEGEEGGRIAQASSPLLSGVVVDNTGAPVGKAIVSLDCLRDSEPIAGRRFTFLDTESSPPHSETYSSSTGEFSFAESWGQVCVAVLWVSKPGFMSEHRVIGTPSQKARGIDPIILERAPSFQARVVDSLGHSVEGARVHHVSWSPKSALAAKDPARRSLAVYRRTYVTGPEGIAEIGRHDGRQALVADKDELRSQVWAESPYPEPVVTLHLSPTAQVFGTVSVDGAGVDLSSLVVSGWLVDAGSYRSLAHGSVRIDGTWGPLFLATSPGGQYVVDLTGPDIVMNEVAVGHIPAGGSRHVTLTAKRGFDIRVLTNDNEGNPITGASASVTLSLDTGVIASYGLSNDAGIARVGGLVEGSGWIRASAPGYQEAISDYVDIRSDESEPFSLTLNPAGVVRGVVTSNGEPVHDFEVIAWSAGADPHTFISDDYRDREDGSFVLEGTPVGEVLVLAFSPKHPRSEAVQVSVEREAAGDVRIELPDNVLGRGRVLDSVTGKVPEGATVQAWSNYGGKLLRPSGNPIEVGLDGSFEIPTLGPGDCRFMATAPGYAQHLGHVLVSGSESVDLGLVPLSPLQTLTVELRSAEPVDFTEYTAQMVGSTWPPIVQFDEHGIAVVPDIGPTRWQITVKGPDANWFTLEELVAGDDWHVVIDVGGSGRLRVLAKDALGRELTGEHSVTLQPATDPARNQERTRKFDPEEGALFTGVAPGRVGLRISRGADGAVVAMDEFEVTGGDQEVVLIVPEERDELLVLGPDGEPLDRAYVQVHSAAGDSPLQVALETGDAGRVRLPSLGRPGQAVGVWHRNYGWHPDLELRSASGGGYFVQLDAATSLAVRLLDGAEPLGGIRVLFRDVTNIFPLNDRITDEAGVALHELLGNGRYRATIDHPGLWRAEHVVEVDGETSVDLQVRRLGELEVHVRTAGGVDVSGQAVDLVWDETGESVAAWLADGRVASSTGALVTDGEGRLVLEGLPRGSYSWSASGGDGHVVKGDTSVEAGRRIELELVAP